MSSEILKPLAELLVAKVEEVEGKGYLWAPADLAPPAGVVELPSATRTQLDEPEDHLGQNDWTITFPVVFYFDLAVPKASQETAVEMVEAFTVAIDADQGLGNACQEAKVVDVAEPEFLDDQARPLIRWLTQVQILKFV